MLDTRTLMSIYQGNKSYWNQKRPELKTYKALYENEWTPYLNEATDVHRDDEVYCRVADAKVAIDKFIASIFARHPNVHVAEDAVVSGGDGEIAKLICNRFLYDQEEQITEAVKIACVYPGSFIKIVPANTSSPIVLDQFKLQAVMPYDVIVDVNARTWDTQRWCGHIYYLPYTEAKKLYSDKDFSTIVSTDYFENVDNEEQANNVPKEYQFVTIIELYDMVDMKIVTWSPNCTESEKTLDTRDIPRTGKDETPVVPLFPMFMEASVDQPLRGSSPLKAIADTVIAKNQLRSAMLDQVSRDASITMYRKGSIAQENVARIVNAKTKEYVPVEGDKPWGEIFFQLPNATYSSNYLTFENILNADLTRAYNLGPFVGGAISGATAEEIATVRAYTNSTLGRMARAKDSCIEDIASCYLRIVAILLEDSTLNGGKEPLVMNIRGEKFIIEVKDLEGTFRMLADDSSFIPEVASQKLAQYMQVFPLFVARPGANKEALYKYLGRLADIPEELVTVVEPPPAPVVSTQPTLPIADEQQMIQE